MPRELKQVEEGSVALVAFGGNAILRSEDDGSIEQQEANARQMCRRLVTFFERGYELVITHGNGPQVGNLLVQNELAREVMPALPLDVVVAQTEGSLGYMLQQELLNQLRALNIRKYVVTMITQVLVDADDPAFSRPTKPVGPFYSKEEAAKLSQRFAQWQMREDAGRGYRRVVPSPKPKRIIQSRMIRSLAYAGNVVIALGGGGVPMTKDAQGRYIGVEAVIDKDFSSALLALKIKADLFVILTGVKQVCLDYGKPQEKPISRTTCTQAREYMKAGHFHEGSMGPKVAAALLYLEGGGREVIITDPDTLDAALDGNGGTRIVWQ